LAEERQLAPDEARLWRLVADSARPLAGKRLAKATVAQDPASASDTGRHTMRARPGAIPGTGAHTTRPLSTAAKPVTTARQVPDVADESGHKRVRRGRLEIDATLDLHGMTRQAAHVELARFLASMRSRGFKCVLVITGKGLVVDPEDYINPQPGVIRRRLPEWLNGHDIRPHVSGYASANARHGGSGAYYVMLKR
jgi:DNA-nicking Smr family endonuclease